MLGDGLPFAPGRESATSAAEQAASCQDLDQPAAAFRARWQAALVVVESLISSCGIRSGEQPADNRRPAGGRLERFNRRTDVQFSGPEVTSLPTIGPPVVAADAGPDSMIVSRVPSQIA
jgi:hypothetical protein